VQRRTFLKNTGLGLGATCLFSGMSSLAGCGEAGRKPNIILILADDLGYNELGCYGQKKIRTPHIDRLAAEGMRFTQFYSGSPVCAPSRSVLMTGQHTGHTHVRDNKEIGSWESFNGQLPLPEETTTLAGMLKAGGYATAAIGKWGLGYPGSPGDPNNQGFDFFYGYNCQRHAHNYYPEFLWKNDSKVTLEGNSRGLTGKQYAPDLMEEQALDFIRANESAPFFMYFATPIPHLALQAPDDSLNESGALGDDPAYAGNRGYLPHEQPRAAYAAMVTRMDRSVGRMMSLLKELHIDQDTIVLFVSDNGPTYLGGYDREFFEGAGGLRSHKGYLYEGGIRVPLIARWPEKIKAGEVSSFNGAFQDIMPTLLEIAGAPQARNIDGISFGPELLGKAGQKEHPSLYMEFPSYGGQQMLRSQNWKAVRQNLLKQPDAAIELYDLDSDPGETRDLSDENPKIVAKLWAMMIEARTTSAEFPFPALDDKVVPVNYHAN